MSIRAYTLLLWISSGWDCRRSYKTMYHQIVCHNARSTHLKSSMQSKDSTSIDISANITIPIYKYQM